MVLPAQSVQGEPSWLWKGNMCLSSFKELWFSAIFNSFFGNLQVCEDDFPWSLLWHQPCPPRDEGGRDSRNLMAFRHKG